MLNTTWCEINSVYNINVYNVKTSFNCIKWSFMDKLASQIRKFCVWKHLRLFFYLDDLQS